MHGCSCRFLTASLSHQQVIHSDLSLYKHTDSSIQIYTLLVLLRSRPAMSYTSRAILEILGNKDKGFIIIFTVS